MSRPTRSLTVVFDTGMVNSHSIFLHRHIHVPDVVVDPDSTADIRTLATHLQNHLGLCEQKSYSLLLEAVCAPTSFSPSPPSSPHSRPAGPYVIPLVCDQVWASVVKSYLPERLKVVVKRRPFVGTDTKRCHFCSLFRRELKFLDMPKYFPKRLRQGNIQTFAEDIFERGMTIKPELRKRLWPHLVRTFHPGLETQAEREMYLSKLRLIYDSLKGRLESQNEGLLSQSQHLYESIRRDAVRTDPSESFYAQRQQDLFGPSLEACLSPDNIEKLVNITAIFTLEHKEVSYTQGMTDLLSPILYVMEREDDAYIVFAAMIQRISENFGTWCEGTLKKVERLRHMCAVLDPQLSAYLSGMEEDMFALFFGMVLIECRREFSFASSFHLMEVIWAAALCMRQKEDPNWGPQSKCTSSARRNSIQALSLEISGLDSTPSFSEWASFMSNRSPDVIRQVFGELQTYSAVPLTRADSMRSYALSRKPSLLSHSPPVSEHVLPISPEQTGRVHPVQREDSLLEASVMIPEVDNENGETPKQNGVFARGNESGYHDEMTRERNGIKEGESSSCGSSVSQDGVVVVQQVEVDVSTNAVAARHLSPVTMSPGKERSQSDPIRTPSNTPMRSSVSGEAVDVTKEQNGINDAAEICIRGLPNGRLRSNSLLEKELGVSLSPPFSPPKMVPKPKHTELSDLSSVSSTNTCNGRGALVTSSRSGDSCGRVERGEKERVRGEREGEERGEREGKMGEVGGSGGGRRGEDGGEVDKSDVRQIHPKSKGAAAHMATARRHRTSSSERRGFSFNLSHIHDSLHSRNLQQVSRDSDSVLEDTPQHMTNMETEDSPVVRKGTVRGWSLTGDQDHAISPIQPFFDTLETIATVPRTTPPVQDGARPSPALSAIITNLLSMEQSVPSVTRQSSLTVPFSDSFPLFICLAIIVQHRTRILHDKLDFVGLSVLLNTQAGAQNLDQTLRIARQLYKKYREYQRLCFGPRFTVYEVWLDDMDTLFEEPKLHSGPQVGGEEEQTVG